MKKILMLILFCGFGLSTYVFGQSPSRVPATPYPIKVVQPNGDTITIRLFGDERQHYFTSIEGYVIVKNAEGYFCYAAMNNDNEMIASKYKVGKRGICVRRYLKKISKNEKLKKTIL